MTAALNQEPTTESWLDIVRQRVEAMRFGSVQIVVHEGRVTQVESTEKTRIPDAEPMVRSSNRKTR